MGNYHRDEYHDSYPSWRNTRNVAGPLIGIELEVEAVDGYGEIIDAIPDTDNESDRPLVEDDSSLSYRDGVEIIFPPIDPRKLVRSGSFFRKTLTALSKVALRDTSGAGMHINVNAHEWPHNKVLLFIALFHHLPARTLENIGGRRLNMYCAQWRTEQFFEYEDSNEHAYAAEWKGSYGRVELRFPKSTTDIRRVQTLLMLVGVAEKWAEQSEIPIGYANADEAAKAVNEDFGKYVDSLKNTAALRKMKEVMKNGYT